MIKRIVTKKIIMAAGAFILAVGGLMFFSLRETRAGEKAGKGWLGVSVQEMTPSLREAMKTGDSNGLLVTNVVAGSPADDAGLREEDVIIEFDGTNVEKSEALTKAVRQTEPEKKVKVVVLRDGARKEFEVVIGKYRSPSFTTMPPRSFSWSGEAPHMRVFSNRVRLGVQVHELDNDLAPYFKVEPKSGALILEVTKESPAAKAGLKSGDIITKVGDEFVRDPDDLIEALNDFEEGDKVAITYVRQGKTATLEAVLEQGDTHGFRFLMPDRSRMHWRGGGEGWDEADLLIAPEIRARDFLQKALREEMSIGIHTI